MSAISKSGPIVNQIKNQIVTDDLVRERSHEYRQVKARMEREAADAAKARKASGTAAPTDMTAATK